MKLFIAWSGDDIDDELARMAIHNDEDGLRKANHAIEQGNNTFKSWLESTDGQIITIDSDGGRAVIQGAHLHELEDMRDRYKEIVGVAASIGIGSSIAEAEISLKVAKLRGGNRALIYTPYMGEELQNNKDKVESLDKTDPATPRQPTVVHTKQPTVTLDHSQEQAMYHLLAQANKARPQAPEATHSNEDFESYLHQAAQKQDDEDTKTVKTAVQQVQDAKKQVALVLRDLRGQAPVLEQIKGQAPKVYKIVNELTNSVIQMAQLLGIQQPMQKMEKAIKDIPLGSEVKPGVFDYSHLLPQQHRDAGYGILIHHNGPRLKPEKPSIFQKLLRKRPTPQVLKDPVNYHLQITHQGRPVGGATATQRKRNLMVNEGAIGGYNATAVAGQGASPQDKSHRGSGLGFKGYEALLAHAHRHGGITHVTAGPTSSMAHKTNQKLAVTHQLDYQPVLDPHWRGDPQNPHEDRGEYDNRYKSFIMNLTEMLPNMPPPKKPQDPKKINKAFGGLPLPHAPKRTHLHLPVGTVDESSGRFKVQTPTGEKWKQGKVGIIMSRQPETAAADFGHPTSSRRPSD